LILALLMRPGRISEDEKKTEELGEGERAAGTGGIQGIDVAASHQLDFWARLRSL
jgi:hypothetical protein